MLKNKTVVLGITGGIAAYKAVDIASKLTQAGANVRVVMTKSALEFITPLTFESITGNTVVTDMFQPNAEHRINHVALSEVADVIVIAPATANIIAKLACGIADDMLTCTVLATRAPVIVSPSMHTNMYENSITQENIAKLKKRGFKMIEPQAGRLASGGYGVGRLPDTETIIGAIRQTLGKNGDLKGKKVVVTAGGTQEAIDPVRYLGNRSSGKMGYAVAEAARDRGAEVTLITAPTALVAPAGIELIKVQSAKEMKNAVAKASAKADALIMAAAVADYTPKAAAKQKIKKGAGGLTLDLVKTPDIISEVKGKFLKIGFAAETENLLANAKKKLTGKGMDMIVANDVSAEGSGFGTDTNKVTILLKNGRQESLPLMSKREVAEKILDKMGKMMEGKM
ncbi:MAG: bifunctional phosphopantothenoylcysteine decarboxylase/phosphopantothenate--cysteine ligase CoaBC [Dehalococcoidales bacterium]|nr:bifunctional phosphopantothenoylcysteine decarboxylase/phosphopantothenate--cysteine ligase CoaBC [Dehalococcoidales bacterium]